METAEQTTILLDIYSRLGSIEAQLKSGAAVEQEIKDDIRSIDARLDASEKRLDPLAQTVNTIKPQHDELVRFHGRVGGVLAVGGILATAAGYLLWEGIKYVAGLLWQHH